MKFIYLLKWDAYHLLRALLFPLAAIGFSVLACFVFEYAWMVLMLGVLACFYFMVRVMFTIAADLRAKTSSLERTVDAPAWLYLASKLVCVVVGTFVGIVLIVVQSIATSVGFAFRSYTAGEIARLFVEGITGAPYWLFAYPILVSLVLGCGYILAGSLRFTRGHRIIATAVFAFLFANVYSIVLNFLDNILFNSFSTNYYRSALISDGSTILYNLALCAILFVVSARLYQTRYDSV